MRKEISRISAPTFCKQRRGGGGGAAGGQQIVNQQHAAAGLDRVGVHGDGVGAVFEVVILLVGLVGELAFFADGHEAGLQIATRRRRRK